MSGRMKRTPESFDANNYVIITAHITYHCLQYSATLANPRRETRTRINGNPA